VDTADPEPPPSPPGRLRVSLLEDMPRLCLRSVGHDLPGLHRNGGPDPAVPAAAAIAKPTSPAGLGPKAAALSRAENLERLAAQIRAIEQRPLRLEPSAPAQREGARLARGSHDGTTTPIAARCTPTPSTGWTLGAQAADALLGDGGLDTRAVHEIKPIVTRGGGNWACAWTVALGFAAALAVRRCTPTAPPVPGAQSSACDMNTDGPVLWCWTSVLAGELGRPYAPGLAGFGLRPEQLLIAETARPDDALWAIEEGLKSRAPSLVIAVLRDIALTPARRLALAAQAYGVPCLLVTDPARPPVAATATRWRIARAPSAANPLDPRAPGAARYVVALERCRRRGLAAATRPLILEWSHEAHRFRLAAGIRDRAHAPGLPEHRAG